MPRLPTLPAVVLALGVLASALLFNVTQKSIHDAARYRFERQARDAMANIEERIQFYSDILYALRALFAGKGPINRLEFHRFVTSLDLKNRFPGFDVVNYAIHVPAENRQQFVESVRRDSSLDPEGYPAFDIRPPGQRAEYYVLAYVEPMKGFEFAFGRDLAANLDAADPEPLVVALHAARDSGKLTASGVPIHIRSRGREYTGLAMRLAVYRSGVALESVAQRRAAYLGSVGAGFNVDDLMKGLFRDDEKNYIGVQLYDIRSAEQATTSPEHDPRLLFDSYKTGSHDASAPPPTDDDAYFSHVLSIEVGGRLWEARFSAPKAAAIESVDRFLPWGVLGGGILSSILLAVVLYSLASSRSRAVAIAEDMTTHLRASEHELRASADQLQALSRRLVEIQESERRELSRELHDRVGQNLTALGITLDILKSQHGSRDADQQRLEDAAALLESTTEAIENVMAELRPPMLDDYGLLSALQWYSNAFTARTGVQVSVRSEKDPGRPSPASEIALFRIAQEALNNVAKHARAAHAEITLARADSRLIMSITDDGVGVDGDSAAAVRRRPGLGMVTMRERTQAVGGVFEIGPAPGRGTQVRVCIPG